ncbi:MAG TPA: VOC family protein, partial [Longimicrobiaceae bacterium]|nr:VOC family protein [Longimicrobiaceae bacterium]
WRGGGRPPSRQASRPVERRSFADFVDVPDVKMQLQDAYPIIVTDKLPECREFYTRWLGFKIVFEASWFVYLASAGERPHGVAFMSADHPSQPPGPETFSGKGMFLTLQVADAEAELQRLRQAGAPIAYPLRDEPWGQRRFALLDPAGAWVDIVQHIEPEPGYWEKYR